MSTRSGKRIHGSFEDSSEVVTLKSEIKTRKRRVEENDEPVVDKKRKNYVRYPSEEDIENKTKIKDVEKSSRKSKRHTLKERNIESETIIDDIPTPRQTRRTKVVETVENLEPHSIKKKNKKKKKTSLNKNNSIEKTEAEDVKPKKKSTKKKYKKSNKTGSIDQLQDTENINKSNMSVDSFHSAAGSPVKEFNNAVNRNPDLVNDELYINPKTECGSADKDKRKIVSSRKSLTKSCSDNECPNVEKTINESKEHHNHSNEKIDLNMGKQNLKSIKRQSNLKNVTLENTVNIDQGTNENTDASHIFNETFEKIDKASAEEDIQLKQKSLRSNSLRNSNSKDKSNKIVDVKSNNEAHNLNDTYEKNEAIVETEKNLNDTYEQKLCESSKCKSSLQNSLLNHKSISITEEKSVTVTKVLNNTYEKTEVIDKSDENNSNLKKSIDNDKDLTYDKLPINGSLNSSNSNNLTFDKSNERISITSDDSATENIVNNTPVVIESSLDESQLNKSKNMRTPLKREGTFTKEDPELLKLPQAVDNTPNRRKSLPSPGCTPFPLKKSTSTEKSVLNVTRSIEKARRSSLVEYVPKSTKVMFCSPINNPGVASQIKKKIIKSSLKGSNKSFVLEDPKPEIRQSRRKRSFTQCDAEEARAKRKRLADDLQESVDRLSRPRTTSASAKLQDLGTPSKKVNTPKKGTPSKEAKLFRTKLPNFAALHQKRFEKMESLDECQERKAKRARQLLTPTGSVNLLERISPKDTIPPTESAKKTDTPTKPKPANLNPVYTRFGFKLNLDNNPFKFSAKNTDVKPQENKPNVLKRQHTLPSLNGATLSRRDFAKQSVMREKSFTDRNVKRTENRTIIKGVRTNRRFDLQMRMRNIV